MSHDVDFCGTDVGLQKDGAAMTMIPTYVTAVPNGTEKVGLFLSPHLAPQKSLTV